MRLLPRRSHLAALMLGALPALAACQPLPHPFEDDHLASNAPLLAMPDAVGIVVAPVENAPPAAGVALVTGMVAGLQDAGIPASPSFGNAHSYRLFGDAGGVRLTGGGASGTIGWTLKRADGTIAGTDRQTIALDEPAWQAGDTALAGLARAEAARIAAAIERPAPIAHVSDRRLYISPVTGAPGDGDKSLPRALAYLMRRAGIALTDTSARPDTVTIAGEVTIVPAPNRQQQVTIAWHVIDPAGKIVGTVSQSNMVPEGTLDGPWSDIAVAVASAGLDALTGLVRQIPETATP